MNEEIDEVYELLKIDDLLNIAKELNWLPKKLSKRQGIKYEEAKEKGTIGDLSKILKEIRNLVHPAKSCKIFERILWTNY